MKKERVYIAGPVTGIDREKVERTFYRWKNYLETLGYEAVCPIDLIPENTEWDEAMYICLFHLSKCHKALFIHDWIHSNGACIEMEFCMQNKIPLISRNFIKTDYLRKVRTLKL